MGDHDALAPDAAAVADLLDLRVDEQVGVAPPERAPSERPTSSSSEQVRETSDYETRSPSDSTSWSTLAQLWDLQLDLARARVPASAIAVSMGSAVIGTALAELGAHQL